jgi:putative colanic acid biosysnthesis UDP-glucose lipid carrier transferase
MLWRSEDTEMPVRAAAIDLPIGAAALHDGNTRFLRTYERPKRLFDFCVASLLLIALLPLFFALAVVIRATSGGPVLFRQHRHGLQKVPFEVLKFRTMMLPQGHPGDPRGTVDPIHITRIGHFLRRVGLDELPQLWNVIRGEMSLVGPRPHPVGMDEHYETLIPYYAKRFRVPPGMTGLAQIRGYRGPIGSCTAIEARTQADIEYIERRSFWLDLLILIRTPLAFFAAFRRS